MDEEWAAPETVLGQLQRGRGAGYQSALRAPGAAAAVRECVAHDPRWDRQTDSRAEYYARLLIALEIPAESIEVDVLDPELPLGVAFGVLVVLSRHGSLAAAGALHEYLRRSPEPDWWVVDTLWDEGGAVARDGLAEVVLARISDEELAEVVRADGPWRAWAHDPRVSAALANASAPWPRLDVPDLTARTSAEVRDLATGEDGLIRTAAYRELSRRGDPVLLDLAERVELRNSYGAAPGLGSPIVDLGTAALPRARGWLHSHDEWLRRLGQNVIAAHGATADSGALLAWFDQAVAGGDWCASEIHADALARLSHRPALPSLLHAWELTPHSLARRHYLPALIKLEAPDLHAYLDEAVDDCEPDVQEIAHHARDHRTSA